MFLANGHYQESAHTDGMQNVGQTFFAILALALSYS
jgi:hypothetical protein